MQVRVAIYCRISEDREEDERGVERQEQDCRARAAREGWSVVGVYVDNDISASTLSRKERPRYAALLAAAARLEFDVILSTTSSRLTRKDPAGKEQLIELNRETGVRFCTILEGDDNYSTSDGRMMARIRGNIDTAYAERISENVASAARQRAMDGRAHGGRRAFGFNRDGTEHRAEGPALRDAIRDVTKGTTIRAVARRWDEAGLFTTTGKPWASSLTNTRACLVRWRNAGVRTYHDEPLFDAERFCAEIVSRAELEELHAVLADRGRRSNGGRTARRALMGGIALCGVCEQPLVKATHGGGKKGPATRADTYRCAGSNGGHVTVRMHKVDEAVEHEVVAALMTDDLTASVESEVDRVRIAEIRSELARVEAGTAELRLGVRQGEWTLAEIRSDLAVNRARTAEREAELLALSSRVAVASFAVRARDLLVLSDEERDAEADVVLDRFLAMDLGQRRELVRALLRVVVRPGQGPDRVEITRRHGSKVQGRS